MCEVLLAHSFFLKNDAKQLDKMKPYPPLGTLYAASHLREQGYTVALFDAMFSAGVHEFEAALERHRPAIVALYEDQFNWLNKMCVSHVREAACEMASKARARGATVVAAGADVTDFPDVYLDRGVQYVLRGEPEGGLSDVVRELLGHRNSHVNSRRHPTGGPAILPRQIVETEPERQPDAFAFPAWDLVDVEQYRTAWRDAHGSFSINMVSTRGCPFHCNWCAKPIWGQRYAMRSPENVAREMGQVKHRIRPDHIWFADDIFGLQTKWVVQFAREVERLDASVPFTIQSRMNLMTDKAVAGLARAGCVEVWLGAESGSQTVLDAMDKGIRVSEFPAVRQRLREAGIRACFFIQFGYPGETLDDILATVDMVRDLMPDDIGISVSYPLPGTRFHEMVKTHLGAKDHWDDTDDLAMMFQGSYETPFYRKLHQVLHDDLELRQKLASSGALEKDLLDQTRAVAVGWFELGQMEVEYRSENPTSIEKDYAPVTAPDLSRRWN